VSILPECEALRFYLTNQAVGMVRNSVSMDTPMISDQIEILRMYHEYGAQVGRRLMYYIMTSCTREARHAKDAISWVSSRYLGKDNSKQFNAVAKYVESYHGSGEGSAVNNLLNNPPKVSIGVYLIYMIDLFMQPWWESGYGGPPWATIAEVGRQLVFGEITLEMATDIGFTLAHNGGPMFNKGVFYGEFDGYTLLKILDMQNAGQIPQFLKSELYDSYSHHSEYKKVYSLMKLLILTFQRFHQGYKFLINITSFNIFLIN